MKKTIHFFIFLLVVTTSKAQSYKASTSSLFEGNIGVPVLLMKDGGSVFQYDNAKERKMYITIFDKNHQALVSQKEVQFKTVNYVFHFSYQRNSNVRCWTEKDNKLAIYMTSENKPHIVLINPKTGNVEKEQEITWDEYENAKGHVFYGVTTNMHVKDPNKEMPKSETKYFKPQYFKPSATNEEWIIETSKWKLLSGKEAEAKKDFKDVQTTTILKKVNGTVVEKIPFDLVNNTFEHVKIKAVYKTDKYMYFITKFHKMTDRASYDRVLYFDDYATGQSPEGVLAFTRFDITTKKFEHIKLIDLDNSIKFESCKILANKDNSNLNLEYIAKVGSKNGNLAQQQQYFYSILFQSMDVSGSKMTAGKIFELPSQKLDEFVQSNCKIKEGYSGGMLANACVDKQGNLFTFRVKNVSSLSNFASDYIYSDNPELIGVTCFDKNGAEIYGAAYPYNTKGNANPYSMTGSVEISKNDFSYVVATASKSNMILLNNLQENYNLPLNKKPEFAKSLDDCNAMAIEFDNSGNMKQHYLFGEPGNKKENRYADFSSAIYDETTNTYLVKIYEGPGFKNTKAAWISLN